MAWFIKKKYGNMQKKKNFQVSVGIKVVEYSIIIYILARIMSTAHD